MVKTRRSSVKKAAANAATKKKAAKAGPVKSQDVYDAISKLQERGGSRLQDVLKYLKANSKGGARAVTQVKVALARGVKQGVLIKKGNAFKLHAKKAKPLQKKASKKARRKIAKKPRRVSVKKMTKRVTKPRKAKQNAKKKSKTKKAVVSNKLKRSKEFVFRRSRRLRRAAAPVKSTKPRVLRRRR